LTMQGWVQLRPGVERQLRRFHPWVFSGAIARVEGAPQAGEVVRVVDGGGEFVAWGYFSPHSKIRVRLLEWREEARVDEEWWWRRLCEAVARRKSFLAGTEDTDAFRLVHAEADLLPGLVVDWYAGCLVVQFLTVGVERVRSLLVEQLRELLSPWVIYERSDTEVRRLEGLAPGKGVLWGKLPTGPVEIREGGYRFLVDITCGQKTGFFLDQRVNRRLASRYAQGRRVLDGFCYTGAFGVYMLGAGAEMVRCVDSSAGALALAERNLALNGFAAQAEVVREDVFRLFRRLWEAGERFDLVVLDPPKFAPRKEHVARAARAYKDVNLLAMRLLSPEGILVTFSCSGGMKPGFFREVVHWASVDAKRKVQVLEQLSAGEDHPVRLGFPESEYLKGLICRVL